VTRHANPAAHQLARPNLDGAACTGTDPEVFYVAPELSAEAKAICRPCPARDKCLEWALRHEDWGVWGGLDENQRLSLKRRMKRKARETA
jgi:WhiB family transcriptional regulator, redox-sensing transcriptional regulator